MTGMRPPTDVETKWSAANLSYCEAAGRHAAQQAIKLAKKGTPSEELRWASNAIKALPAAFEGPGLRTASPAGIEAWISGWADELSLFLLQRSLERNSSCRSR